MQVPHRHVPVDPKTEQTTSRAPGRVGCSHEDLKDRSHMQERWRINHDAHSMCPGVLDLHACSQARLAGNRKTRLASSAFSEST